MAYKDKQGRIIKKGARVVVTPSSFNGPLLFGVVSEIISEFHIMVINEETGRELCRTIGCVAVLNEAPENNLPLTDIQEQYDDGLCPDCGLEIPSTAEHEDSCTNCDHVFVDVNQMDMSTVDPEAENV